MRPALLLFTAAAWAQQPPKPEDLASLSGTIINALTGEPIRKANVTLNSPQGVVRLQSDGAGRFSVAELLPGRYSVTAEATGFLEGNLPDKDAIVLAAGARKTGVVLKLSPHGVVAGRVLDEDGDPVMDARVMTLPVGRSIRRAGMSGLLRGATSNDLGEFRIPSLPPGSYLLVAHRPQFHRSSPSASAKPIRPPVLLPTYFPSHTDPTTATVIKIVPGAELRGHDIRLRLSPAVTIRGRVDYPAPPDYRVSVALARVGGGPAVHLFQNNGATTKPDGSFEIQQVTPGEYTLWTSIHVNRPGDPTYQLTARTRLQVAGADLEGIVLTPRPPIEVTGRLIHEGAPSDLSRVTVALHRKHKFDSVPGAGGQGKVNADGRFVVLNIPSGEYRVGLYQTGPADRYIRNATFAGHDILAAGLDLTSPGELLIKTASDGGTLQGRVTLPETRPATPVVVLAWPAGDARAQIHRLARSSIASDGSFELRGIPPGSYRLAAVTLANTELAEDPDFLKELEEKAEALEVAPNSQQTRALTLLDLNE